MNAFSNLVMARKHGEVTSGTATVTLERDKTTRYPTDPGRARSPLRRLSLASPHQRAVVDALTISSRLLDPVGPFPAGIDERPQTEAHEDSHQTPHH